MSKHSFMTISARLLRRHWLVALCVAMFAGILWIGTPAWAAPVARPLYQTVPRPTPVGDGDPVATATPRPDDDDDDDNDNDDEESDDGSSVPADAPNITFPQDPNNTPAAAPGGAPVAAPVGAPGAAPTSDLTAQVTVANLNVREAPTTTATILGNIAANTEVTVLARSDDGAWWYICCLPDSETAGWASAQLLAPDFDPAQADTLIPLFEDTTTTQANTQALPLAELPLSIDFQIDPYFVWQGITATLTITVNNPNAVDAVNVILSDELPRELTLIEAIAEDGGTVQTATTANQRPLLLFRWPTIPAESSATVTIVTQVASDLDNGTVIDNLVATRGRNIAYNTGVLTIGMPPVVLPDFQ